jgi:ribosomal protein S18 acetylase RimI-like enzyme
MLIREAEPWQVKSIVDTHLATFPGFFLTFMGPGFLKCLYQAYISHRESQLLIAENDMGELLGFVAFTNDLSGFYHHLLRRSLIPLAWYSFLSVLSRPSVFFRLLKGFAQPRQSIRAERYAELSSIGVEPSKKHLGIGSKLIGEVKKRIDFVHTSYLKLETDADNNDDVNVFYLRNGFTLHHSFTTAEGRKMNEYRYVPPAETV